MKSKSFRLTEEAAKNLAELSDEYMISEAKIINILLTEVIGHYNLSAGMVGPLFADDILGLNWQRKYDERQERMKSQA